MRVIGPATTDGVGIVFDGDLRAPLNADDSAMIANAFQRHGVLVWRNQSSGPDDQVRLMATLGRVLTIPGEPELPYGYVSNVRPDGTLGERELTMHSDWSWWHWPLDGISLASVEVSDAVSSTRFTDNIAAWNDLDESVRERVVGLQARHVINTSPHGQNRTEEPDPARRQAVHPVVAETPAGDRYLYVNQTATHSIEGMPLPESAALLQLLFDEMYRPEHVYEHEWRSGDVVVWNNRTMQHARGATAPEHPRTLSRVVIGENSLYEMEPEMRGQHLTKKS